MTDVAQGERLRSALENWHAEASAPQARGLLSAARDVAHVPENVDRELAHAFLDATSHPDFLELLDREERETHWVQICLALIRATNYTLHTMLRRRSEEDPERILLQEPTENGLRSWSVEQVRLRARRYAATLIAACAPEAPRVALFLDNSVAGACCDLGCLSEGLLVTPLSVHTPPEHLAWILRRLQIRAVVTDTPERQQRIWELRRREGLDLAVLALEESDWIAHGDAVRLDEQASALSPREVEEWLERAPTRHRDRVASLMFTSGSTGRPKGVVFTDHHLVTKRFCRAAALPRVGREEALLCYLPLYHTFGRFLELLAMLYWRGRYVFVGNTSAESFLSLLPRVEPTGLIGIPLRWKQIRDRALAIMDRGGEGHEEALRSVVGSRLSWGLSAAGYLDPKVFRFFHRFGIELCSGFGMTEATGGITMSPPGSYLEDTVGRPLPGIDIHLDEHGEMSIGGPYVADYLEPEGEGLEIVERAPGPTWLRTGDLFEQLEDGQLEIVDRIKDIYKNDRGQTIAPRKVERVLEEAAGIHRAFLVGDHLSWNVLLLVPDREDAILQQLDDPESEREYFERIIAAANESLAPFERVMDFALLARDFDESELTPKHTYRRKVITERFADVIAELYRSPQLEHEVGGILVRLPRWILRDLGSLESDWVAAPEGLRDLRHGRGLRILRDDEGVQVGNFVYQPKVEGDPSPPIVDLGVLARQPRLWLGNAELCAAIPCRAGWDVAPDPWEITVLLPAADAAEDAADGPRETSGLPGDLARFHERIARVLLGEAAESALELEELGRDLTDLDERLASVLRSRLASLARHPVEELRCQAYRILLLDRRTAEEDPGFGYFLDSGLSFLSEESIRVIARASVGPRRLTALRRRLSDYRRRIAWPARPVVRQQIQHILGLLGDFVRHQEVYYKSVRAELASWILLGDDPELAAFAEGELARNFLWFEERLDRQHVDLDESEWNRIARFDADVDRPTRQRLRALFCETSFLEQAVILAHEEEGFRVQHIAPAGLWVARVQARGSFRLLRVSVNTRAARHFDLLVVLREDMNTDEVRLTNNWLLAIAGQPQGTRAIPRFGCARPELSAMAMEFVNDLTVEARLRILGAAVHPHELSPSLTDWRRIYVSAMSAVFRAWDHGYRKVIPGQLTPANISVPEEDFQDSPLVLSLTEWRKYEGPLSLVRPLYTHFYERTYAQIPATAELLEVDWIFDAAREGLGDPSAKAFFEELEREVESLPRKLVPPALRRALRRQRKAIESEPWIPLALPSAVRRYWSWCAVNPAATLPARIDQIEALIRLYRLERFGEPARYRLFGDTLLRDASEEFHVIFDRLLAKIESAQRGSAVQQVELSELQDALEGDEQRDVFRHLAFPRSLPLDSPELIAYGDSESPNVAVRTKIVDRRGEDYRVREPMTPEEVGQLYRLFFRRRFPKAVSEFDRYLIAIDHSERMVAGVCYQHLRQDTTFMEGVVVDRSVEARGVASALLEDFCARLAARGIAVVQTGFFMQSFCEGRGFRLDRRYSGLVRFLDPGREH